MAKHVAFTLQALCGAVYSQQGHANVVFHPDIGSDSDSNLDLASATMHSDRRILYSPVRNRVALFDLTQHRMSTLAGATTRKDIQTLAIEPHGKMLVAVDTDGRAVFVNLMKRVPLGSFNFRQPVKCMRFSHDGKYIAVTHMHKTQVWHTPPLIKTYQPLVLHRTYTGHYDDVTCIEWTPDSQYFITGSKDMTCRLYSLHAEEEFTPITLTGHRGEIIGVFFDETSEVLTEHGITTVYSISKDGALFEWHWERASSDQKVANSIAVTRKRQRSHPARPAKGSVREFNGMSGIFTLQNKHYFKQNHAKVTTVDLYRIKRNSTSPVSQASLLVAGFDSGMFALYELPDFNNIHSLSVSNKHITTVAIDSTGQWLAMGSSKLGQLLVWEWQSETYVLKQQGHFFDVNCVAFSPDGQLAVTGGDDGKVKIWNTSTGFCFVTFSNHSGPVTSVEFSAIGNVVFSSSLDGTVRAHDLVRYRNFRTMTSPQMTQFSSLAIDPSGEVVCAGSIDPFEIYVWSLRTGRLLDVCAGHEGPISGLSFSASTGVLASCSWDKSVRLWDVFAGKGETELFLHTSDVLALAFRPDGRELCSTTLDGNISFWNVQSGEITGVIEGKRDIMGGRRRHDARSTANNTHATAFTSVSYNADGTSVLAGGNSKFVCIYDVESKILVKKFSITDNMSLDGVQRKLNSKYMTEAGVLDDFDLDNSDVDDPADRSLPGAKTGELSRKVLPLARSKCVRFSPTGLQWAAATTEGLVLFGADIDMIFDPRDLELDVTPSAVRMAVAAKQYSRAVAMGLILNIESVLKIAVESTPTADIQLVCRSLSPQRVPALIAFIANQISSSQQIHYYLQWTHSLLSIHGRAIQSISNNVSVILRQLQKGLTQQFADISRLANDNLYSLDFVHSFAESTRHKLLTIDEADAAEEAIGDSV